MKGNEKISFTAEAVAFLRTREGSDKFNKYFVSSNIKNKFKFFERFMSSYLNKIAYKRATLSKDIDKFIKIYKPEQVIELACGYSTRGLNFTQKDLRLVYIETDFSSVIEKKKKILKKIEKEEKIKLSKNHHFIAVDVISDELFNSLKKLIDKNKKTLIVAEALVSYFDTTEHDFLIKNIINLLSKVSEGAYLNHEPTIRMLPGLFGKLLVFYRDKIVKTKSHYHFKNSNEIKNYFLKKGFRNVRVHESKNSKNLIYLVEWKS